jgi:cytochrome b subunit of formate dehydrogenase
MSSPRHRRFTRTEVVLHGLHAVFYLALWMTGLFLIVQRTLGTEWFSIPDLSHIHRKVGVVFAVLLTNVLLLSLLIPVIRVFWKTVWGALHWTAKDIVWLVKMPLHILFPKVKLPPSGRFNPGQKINILVVLTTVSGLCLSGVWMVRVPGALVPWIIHVGCVLVGSILLGIHLYLALINPPTRQAFRAMIDGTVSPEYVRIHHPLSLPPPVEQVHDPHVYRLPLFLTVILMIGAFAAGVWAYGPERFVDQYRLWRQSSGMISLQPGPLIPGHAGEKESGTCTACHEDLDRPESEFCLDCHAAIAERMEKRIGYHGKLSGRCVDCHTEHKGSDADIRPLDRKAFNHLQADFALDGVHARLDCPACHLDKSPAVPGTPKRFQFIGIEHSTCTSCHTDPHQDPRSADCLKCHTTQSWRRPELTFDHNRDSRFALQGKHTRVACDKCHPDTPTKSPRIRLYDLGTCKDCHRDRHQGQFQDSCEHCHNEKGFKNIDRYQFHGPESKFPLRGGHAKTACNKCHTPADKQRRAPVKFVGLDTQCQSCHQDPHKGQFPQSCEQCHSEQSWNEDYGRLYYN